MKLQWHAAVLLLTTARAQDIAHLERLYIDGTTPDTTDIGGREVATLSQPQPQGHEIDSAGWTAECTGGVSNQNCDQVFDNNVATYWQSANNSGIQTVTINLAQQERTVSGLIMVPRQDTTEGLIEAHQIFLSLDGANWEQVAYGTWWPDNSQKLSAFQPKKAKYVRLSASAPNGIAIAEIKVYETDYIAANAALGAWGPTIDLPLVPVAGAVDPKSGEVVTWSAWGYNIFTGGKGGKTQTATWNPQTRSVTRRRVTNTHHDMFCPGISTDQNGKIVVTGGADAGQTSIYNTSVDVEDWFEGSPMNIFRGYQASTTLSDGRMFVIGGSFSGGVGDKNGEVYDPKSNKWTVIPGALASAMLTDDQRTYRQDNHGWIFAWTNGSVFQAGPSKGMHWYGTSGNGTTTSAGDRTGDQDAMCGNAVMYDKGKILTFGGSPWYETTEATQHAAIITIDKPDQPAAVQQAGAGMHFKRTFHSSVVLPDGSVFVNGGQVVGLPFNESQSHLTPERFIPNATDNMGGTWVTQQPNSIVRVYHSIALLLQDGTVFTAGGGLCGNCSANHFDGQVYTPPYLLKPDGTAQTRPVIKSVTPNSVKPGSTVEVTTEGPVDTDASIIRYGSATHTVDTDQRRIGVHLTSSGTNKYKFEIPSEPGIAQPGYYMLFVLKNGVPSHSVNVQVTV